MIPAANNAVTGAAARLAIATGPALSDVNWATAASGMFTFLSESMQKVEQVVNSGGIRGTRARAKEQDRAGTYTVGGTVSMIASAGMLEVIFPLILGAEKIAEGGGDDLDRYHPSDTLLDFGMLIDKLGAIYEYRDCYVNRATFNGTKDQPITVDLDIVAKEQGTESSWPTVGPGAMTAINTGGSWTPYIFTDLDLDLDGQEDVPINTFSLSVDNAIDVQHRNSQAPTSLVPHDRTVTLTVEVPFNTTTEPALYSGASDTNGQVVMSSSTCPCTIKFPHLALTKQTATVPGKSELGLTLQYEARSSGYAAGTSDTHDIYIDLDSTV